MKIEDLFNERKTDPTKLAKRTGSRYGKEKNYGYNQSGTIPGQYIPLKNYDDELVDDMEFAKHEMYKKFGWNPGDKNLPEIRKELEHIASSRHDIEIRKLYATQPFVRIEDPEVLKSKLDSNKTISVTKYQNRYFIIDGHHAVLAAKLRGELLINAIILDLDALIQKYKKEERYTAKEWAIISGGHVLEETKSKHKLFDFGKY
jgi:hypothetical protein